MPSAIPQLSSLTSSFSGLMGNAGSSTAVAKKPALPNLAGSTGPSSLMPLSSPPLGVPSVMPMSSVNSSTPFAAKPPVPNLGGIGTTGTGAPITSSMNTSTPSPTAGVTPSTSNMQVGPSGHVFNANTGGVMNGGSMMGTGTAIGSNPAVGPGATGGFTAPSNPSSLLSSSLFTSPAYEAAMKAYQTAQNMTPEETQNQTDINNLQNSFRTAYTNAEGQPIPLEFITGQQRQLQNQALNLEQPLDQRAALLQARRTATLEGTKFALDTEAQKLAALREYTKPITLPYGGQLVEPQNGTTINGGVFGTNSTTAGKISIDPSTGLANNASPADIMGYLARNGIDTTRYNGPGLINAVQSGATASDILAGRGSAAGLIASGTASGSASAKADADSLKTQQEYLDTTTRSLGNADAGLKQVIGAFDGKVNNNSMPIANIWSNAAQYQINPGDVAAYKAALAEVGNEYAQVFSRGGQVTDTVRNKSNDIIDGNISVSDLKKVSDELQAQGKIVIGGAQGQIDTIKKRISNNGSNGSGTNMGNSSNNNQTISTPYGSINPNL